MIPAVVDSIMIRARMGHASHTICSVLISLEPFPSIISTLPKIGEPLFNALIIDMIIMTHYPDVSLCNFSSLNMELLTHKTAYQGITSL